MLAVFLVANRDLVRGRAVGLWDADSQFFPYFTVVADFARAGRLMRWDPWTNGGLPTFAEPQVGALSPINNILGLITGGGSSGFIFYWLSIWFLGGIGVMLLGRHLRAPAWAACAVGVGYLFCGVYMGNAQHTSWLVGFSFIPWIIWRLDVALQTRRILPAAQAGALWGLAALSSHPAVIILTGCYAGLWAVGRAGDAALRERGKSPPEASGPTFGYALGAVALLALVGIIVLAPVYLSFVVESAGVTGRVGALSRDEANVNPLHPFGLVTMVSAYAHRLNAAFAREVFPGTDPSMQAVYIGVLIPTLAMLALVVRPKDRWRWWVAGIGVFSLAAAMGESLPLRGWLYDFFPPMRFFRHSGVFRLLFLFSLTVLALIGARELSRARLRGEERIWQQVLRVTCILGALALVGWGVFLYSVRWAPYGPVAFLMPGGWIGLVAVAVLFRRLPRVRAGPLLPLLLIAIATGDAILTSSLSEPTLLRRGRSVDRWQTLDSDRVRSVSRVESGLYRDDNPCEPGLLERCRRNDQLITKVPTFNANPSQWNVAHREMLALPALKSIAIGDDRVWFSRDPIVAPPVHELFDELARLTEGGARPPMLLHSREQIISVPFGAEREVAGADWRRLEAAPAIVPAPVRLVEYAPESLILEFDSPGDGWLMVTDRWAPSWRASVNGTEVDVLAANFIYRAVGVVEGRNRVHFWYAPRGVTGLIILSWGTLAMVAGVSLFALSDRIRIVPTHWSRVTSPRHAPDDSRGR